MMFSPSLNSLPQRQFWVTFALLSYFVVVSIQQKDPIDDFCRRWGHQSAVVDDKLYIDGGLATYSGSDKNVTNSYLIYHDLSTVASSGMPPPYANLSKNSTIPKVNGGTLWPDTVNKRIYLYGGEFYDEKPSDFSLYSYDIINDQWDKYSSKSSDVTRLSYGAGLSISSLGQGYYYGGWMNNQTDPDWSGDPITSSYMLIYDMDSNKWSNNTGPDDIGRAEGVMLYLPAGDGGMIIYFGGIRGTDGGKWEGQPMEEIIIYDVLSGKSYTQNATGDVPDMRRRFCAGATWTDDQSSYNIYLYGGLGEEDGSSGFDDSYVLTIPTFTWVRMYPTDSNKTGPYPHHSLSCNVVNEAQMIIHGGFFPLTDSCDSSDQWGLHNMDMGEQNKDDSLWALWEPTKTNYVVPTPILSIVGGKSTGGATKSKPTNGWDFPDLGVLMTRKAEAATRTATRDVGDTSTSTATASSKKDEDDDSSNKISTGAIVGIAVGSAAVVALVAAAAWFLLRRRRSGNDKQPQMVQTHDQYSPQDPAHTSTEPLNYGTPTLSTVTPPPFHTSPSSPVYQHHGYATVPVELPTDVKDVPNNNGPQYDAHGHLMVPRSPEEQANRTGAESSPSPALIPHELASG